MNRRLYCALAAGAIIASFSGCERKPPEHDVLAIVSNRAITLGQLNSRIAKMPLPYQRIVTGNKKRYLNEMIVEMLFYEEAVRSGVDKDPEVKEVVAEAKKKIITAKFIKDEVEDKLDVSDAEMRAYYDGHREAFKTPPMWRASHILVSNEKEAADILTELAGGARFEDLARSHSMDMTASRGGDIGFFRTGQLVPEFERACLKLKVGEMSGIIRTQFGYHIIMLTDVKEPSFENFDTVKRTIESELKKQRRSSRFEELVTGLKKKYNVRVAESALGLLDASEKGRNEKVAE